MDTTTYIAISRQTSIFNDINTIANNIANASTSGYRAERTLFQEYLMRTGSAGHRDSLSFTQDIGQFRDTRSGPLTVTGNSLDLTIQGNGYFVVGNPSEQFYSRTGAFHLDDQGRMVTGQGYPILDTQNNPITLPTDGSPINVTADGVISNRGGQIATLQVVQFADEQLMRRTENGVYATDQNPTPATNGKVLQGSLEASNVQPIFELTRLVDVSKQYESTQNLLQAEDERQKSMMKALVGSA
jgi:flagellar basal-body rod protein FlgF